MTVLKNILATLLAIVALVLAFAFSLVLLAVFVMLGLSLWIFFWWRARRLRGAAGMQGTARASGVVIEGEVVEVREGTTTREALPHERDPR